MPDNVDQGKSAPNADELTQIRSLINKGKERITALENENRTLKERAARKPVSLPGVNEEKGTTFSFRKVIAGMAMGGLDNAKVWDDLDAGHEREVGLEARKRALSYGTASAGGYVVPQQYLVSEFINLLRARTVAMELGATVLTGLTSAPVKIPKQTGGATAYWVAENNPITDSSQTFDELSLEPKELAALTKLSGKLVMLGSPDAEGIVRNDLAAVLARALDLAALRGTGSGNQPTGIKNTSGVSEVASIGAPTVEDLYEILLQVETDNADVGKLGWAMHPQTLNSLRKLRSDGGGGAGTGPFILNPDPTQALKGTLLGMPYRLTTQLPSDGGTDDAEIYFGNWQDLYIAQWGSLEILASREAGDAFAYNQLWVRAILECDIGVRHAESFCIGTGIGV